MGVKLGFLFSLGGHPKHPSNEGRLAQNISLAYPSDLSLSHHVQDLVALSGSPRRLTRKEAHPRLDQPFDEPMILLNNVVEIFNLSQFTRFWNNLLFFQLLEGSGIGSIFVDRDHSGLNGM